MLKSVALALSAAALLCACDEKKEEAASTTSSSTTSPPSDSATTPIKTTPEKPPTRKSLAEALAPFDGALDLSGAKEIEPPEKPLAWSIPEGCKLGYQANAFFSLRSVSATNKGKKEELSASARRPHGMTVEADYDLERGGPANWQLSHGDIVISHTNKKVRRAPAVQPAGSTAKVWLSHEDGVIEEVQGPTATWSAFGTYPGTVLFFPAIPEVMGEERDWRVKFHVKGSGLKVESERGSTKLPPNSSAPEPRARIFTAQVTIDRWIELRGQRVALLELKSKFGEGIKRNEDGTLKGRDVSLFIGGGQYLDGEQYGHYLITEEGQLLAARFTTTQLSTMFVGFGKGHVLVQATEGDYETRMIRGCKEDALVAKSFDRARSPEERALMIWAKVRDSTISDKIDEPLEPLFAPEVWAAHGDRIKSSLDAMVARFGIYSLGAPELAYELDAKDGTVRAVMTGNARYYRSLTNTSRQTLHVVVNFRIDDGEPRITSVGIDTRKKDGDWEVFEISNDRLHMSDR